MTTCFAELHDWLDALADPVEGVEEADKAVAAKCPGLACFSLGAW